VPPAKAAPDAARILDALTQGKRRSQGMLSAPAPTGGLVDLVADVLDFVIPGDSP